MRNGKMSESERREQIIELQFQASQAPTIRLRGIAARKLERLVACKQEAS